MQASGGDSWWCVVSYLRSPVLAWYPVKKSSAVSVGLNMELGSVQCEAAGRTLRSISGWSVVSSLGP